MVSATIYRFPDYPSLCPADGYHSISDNNAMQVFWQNSSPPINLSMHTSWVTYSCM